VFFKARGGVGDALVATNETLRMARRVTCLKWVRIAEGAGPKVGVNTSRVGVSHNEPPTARCRRERLANQRPRTYSAFKRVGATFASLKPMKAPMITATAARTVSHKPTPIVADTWIAVLLARSFALLVMSTMS
jgi:hypothetical protein